MRRLLPILFPAIIAAHSAPALAQSDDTSTPHPEDREVDMDTPTFDPMVKVGKVLIGKDSVQYVEVNKVYVYPEPEFKDAKQRMAYNRLVYKESFAHRQGSKTDYSGNRSLSGNTSQQKGERRAHETSGKRHQARIHATHEETHLRPGQTLHQTGLPRV